MGPSEAAATAAAEDDANHANCAHRLGSDAARGVRTSSDTD